jgi:DNA-binding NarL/FixJ family response regulator
MSQQITIGIVSNSCLLRDGLVALLRTHMDIVLVAAYTGELPQSSEPPNPPGHMVLIDSGIGQAAALAWTRFWCCRTPPAAVIILELTEDKESILACIEAGAKSYTLRGAGPAEVVDTIALVSQGQAQCSPEVTAYLFRRLSNLRATAEPTYSALTPLTSREHEVLQLVARGYSNKDIAARLCITLRTVKQHVHNILHKLELKHRYEAAQLARERGWVASEEDTAAS